MKAIIYIALFYFDSPSLESVNTSTIKFSFLLISSILSLLLSTKPVRSAMAESALHGFKGTSSNKADAVTQQQRQSAYAQRPSSLFIPGAN